MQGIAEKFFDYLFNTWLVLRPTSGQECTCGRSEVDKDEKLGMERLV